MTNSETTSFTTLALTDLTTYNWCARNDDGIFTSNSGNFTTMGSFTVDLSFSLGGGLGTFLSQPTPTPDPSETPADPDAPLVEELNLSLNFSDVNGGGLTNPIALDSLIIGTIEISNPTDTIAENVFVNLQIPEHILYVPGSLLISGVLQSDGADQDQGQGDQSSISVIWDTLGPGELYLVSFQLLFNQSSLQEFVQASVNPTIELQASVSATNASEVFLSELVVIEPNLEIEIETEEETEEEIEIDEPLPDPEPDAPSDPEVVPDPTPDPESSLPIQAIPPPEPISPPTIEIVDTSTPIIPLESEPAPQDEEINELLLTGTAQSQNEQLEFSGTTSSPNAEITVIINDLVLTLVSDENGLWQAFVSAEELGVQEGESTQVSVEAFATKDDKESNRISQQIFVERFTDELIAEPVETTVSSNAVIEVFEQVQSQVQEIIEEQEEEIQTTLAVAAPVVIASSIPLWGYLPYIPTMLFHLISSIVGLLGRKKQKDERFYGVVYDSISKEPIPLAIVRIYKLIDTEPGLHSNHSRHLVTTVVTDKQGRYEALLESAEYEIEVRKPSFTFPSKIVTSGPDGEYTTLYTGIISGESISIPDIPLDPEKCSKKMANRKCG